jgi:hypothetical protein
MSNALLLYINFLQEGKKISNPTFGIGTLITT